MANSSHFTAETLKKKGGSELVKHESLEIHRAIKSKIREVCKFKNCIEYDLPTVFSVEGYELKDVQLLVYTDIITQLEKEDFMVTIDIGSSNTRLYVRWSAGLDDEERERRRKILANHIHKR